MAVADAWATLLGFAALAAIAVAAAAIARRLFPVEASHDSVVETLTADGWRLGVRIYRPAERMFVEPVILCHGLGVSGLHFDLSAKLSLARRLSDAGFLVLVPDLRGRGLSRCSPSGARRVRFADHAEKDGQALVDAARRLSGSPQVFWVGHSMGGMAGAVLAVARSEALAGLVAMAVPYRPSPQRGLRWAVRAVLAFPGTFPLSFAASLLAPFVTPTWPPVPDLVAVRSHLDRRVLGAALAQLLSDLPRGLLSELAGWGEGVAPLVADGLAYPDHWVRVACPLFVVAGSADVLAPPDDAGRAFEAAASSDKEWAVICDNGGLSHGVGHGDLLLGREAPRQVFPAVRRWLEMRARRTAAGMVKSENVL
jgi:pimeloyl-ACP methyl ester carboxylesterase